MRALVDGAIQRAGFEPLPISVKHAIEAGRRASPHRDPFDRMLSAQSRLERIPLITDDLGDERESLRSSPGSLHASGEVSIPGVVNRIGAVMTVRASPRRAGCSAAKGSRRVFRRRKRNGKGYREDALPAHGRRHRC